MWETQLVVRESHSLLSELITCKFLGVGNILDVSTSEDEDTECVGSKCLYLVTEGRRTMSYKKGIQCVSYFDSRQRHGIAIQSD